MTTFVLLPGPWMGAWAWEPVATRLRALGHQAHPLTLPGLDGLCGDASHIGLSSHVDHVLAVLVNADLRDVVLVSHSYSGIVAGQVADRASGRVAHTVYVEAVLPRHGRSMLQAFPPDQQSGENALIADNHGYWPAPDADLLSEDTDLTSYQAQWLADHCVGHPGRTITEPAVLQRPLAEQRATYVVCAKDHVDDQLTPDVAVLRTAPTWAFHTIDTGHWPMFTAPDELAALLGRIR
ncbi:alpha/beta hydrolase [Streptosporangium sp. NPDC049644]|uniref:alpha/beta fold hydrolase n=1 Tax=Streptosporangium sp. NPDC049644 TaxID=3155507 RepID=UPI00343F0655